MEPVTVLIFFHSLLRWLIVISVGAAGLVALSAWLRQGPVMNWHRTLAIWAMIFCHAQVLLGLALYLMRFDGFSRMAKDQMQYWKFGHIALMLAAVALVTAGRLASRKAFTERAKHARVAVFYLAAWVLMLAYTPWPGTDMGIGRGWL